MQKRTGVSLLTALAKEVVAFDQLLRGFQVDIGALRVSALVPEEARLDHLITCPSASHLYAIAL
jgi:hypothetical protein